MNLPLIWKANRKARVTKGVFTGWLVNHFCPEVKPARLMLDNASEDIPVGHMHSYQSWVSSSKHNLPDLTVGPESNRIIKSLLSASFIKPI